MTFGKQILLDSAAGIIGISKQQRTASVVQAYVHSVEPCIFVYVGLVSRTESLITRNDFAADFAHVVALHRSVIAFEKNELEKPHDCDYADTEQNEVKPDIEP